ncbi:MAG: hypothetical protein ACJ788_24455 [Ktedonobacteraceae bacterium]
MNSTLIGPAITIFIFSGVGLLIALALWIGLSKPKQPLGDCIRQAELVIYQHQVRLNRQQAAVPKVDPNE